MSELVAAAVVTGLFGCLGILMQRTKKTGNGFAALVEGALARLETDVSGIKRDLGGMREEIRTERKERLDGDAELRTHLTEKEPIK